MRKAKNVTVLGKYKPISAIAGRHISKDHMAKNLHTMQVQISYLWGKGIKVFASCCTG